MKDSDRSMRFLPAAVMAAGMGCALMAGGCKEEVKEMAPAVTDLETTPTMLTRNVSTLISDSGYTRYHITAPLWLMFENSEEPNWKFPDGLDIEKYDDDMNTDATVECDSATYLSQRRLWRLDGNVRMRNTAGDRFLTQQLFWDQQKHTVYSDSFIHIERSDRIIEGYGFLSNEKMTAYTVNRPSGIFPVPERREGAGSTDSLQNQQPNKQK